MDYKGRFYIEENVVRWKSNNSVPPEDCMEEMVKLGFITETNKNISEVVREEETAAFLANYRKQMETYVPSDEERFEMRAAFGEGATVVNAITGKSIKL